MFNFACIIAGTGISLDFHGSTILLILLILFGLGWTVLAYRQTVPPTRLSLRILLGSLRALALLLVIFLIFEPSLSLRRERHLKPLVAVIFDDTQSMALPDASGPRQAKLERLMRDPAWKELGRQFDLKAFAAGDSLRDIGGVVFDSMRFKAIGTDLVASWEQALRQQDADTFGAIILVSDGGDNAGRNPVKAAQELSLPLYVVGIGDTAAIQDASIASVSSGQVAYRGKETQIAVRLKARGMEGQNAALELTETNGRVLAREEVRLPMDELEAEVSLKFTPQQVGTLPLNVRMTSPANEWSSANNQRGFPLEVRESRIRALVISATPGFEAMFLARTMAGLPDVEVKTFSFRQDGNFYGSGNEQLVKDFAEADVLLLIGLLDQNNPTAIRDRMRRLLVERTLPIWVWAGSHPSLEDLKATMGEAPFQMLPGSAQRTGASIPLRYYAELDPDAESAESSLWNDLPPLNLPGFRVLAGLGAQSLIGLRDPTTGADLGPALLTWESGGKRSAISFGSGYWKWSFLAGGLEGSDNLYRNYLGQMLRWLAASSRSRPLKFILDRKLYASGEPVRLEAQVMGGEGRFISSAQVEATLQGPEGASRVILEPDGSGRYSGVFHPETVGPYTYRGVASINSDTLGSDSGNFMVEAYNIEKEALNQNQKLLQQIAQVSGGDYFAADSVSRLNNRIQAPPRVMMAGWTRRFFLNWDIWMLLVGALSLEWLIRKRKGML
jgi:hypothetical protein